ncbi:hypothetical protein LCGC14_1944690, partial [marine sediment metagenome]
MSKDILPGIDNLYMEPRGDIV